MNTPLTDAEQLAYLRDWRRRYHIYEVELKHEPSFWKRIIIRLRNARLAFFFIAFMVGASKIGSAICGVS